MLNKILFGLLKFYFTLNTGRKKTSYTFFNFFTLLYFTLPYLTKKSVFSIFLKTCKLISFYFTLLCITLPYFELRWQHTPYYTMLYYLWYKV